MVDFPAEIEHWTLIFDGIQKRQHTRYMCPLEQSLVMAFKLKC